MDNFNRALIECFSKIYIMKSLSNIVFGMGVPFKRFGMEQGKLISYLQRKGETYFAYEDVDYLISIQNVFCFPQYFVAVADRLGNMKGRYVIADIGSWTKDVICIEDRKVKSIGLLFLNLASRICWKKRFTASQPRNGKQE